MHAGERICGAWASCWLVTPFTGASRRLPLRSYTLISPTQPRPTRPQVVVQAYKRHGVPLPYALSSFAPTLMVRCPQLVVVAALRDGSALRSGPLALGPGGRHELVAVLDSLRMGVRWARGAVDGAASAHVTC